MRRGLWWAALALFLASPAWSATYYVSTLGSDGNSCLTAQSTTQTNAKATISAGVECAATAGDVVDIRGGIYTGSNARIDNQDRVVASGTSFAAAITIRGHSGETVTIRPPANVSAIKLVSSIHHVIIEDLTLDMVNSGPGTTAEGVFLYTAHHIRMQRLDLKNGFGFGVHYGDDTPNNEFLDSQVHGFGEAGGASTEGHGFYITASDNLFAGNDVYDNAGYGFHIYNNRVPHVDPCRNVIRNNKIHHNGTGSGTTYGLVIAWGDANEAYNNLIYNNKGGAQIYTEATNTVLVNNTIYGNVSNGLHRQYYGAGQIIRNNIVYNNGTAIVDDGSAIPGASATVSNNLTSNPSFTDASAGDFTLVAGSAAINAGATIAVVTVDYAGISRPQGASYDIGAFEFASGSAPTITTMLLPDGQQGTGYSQLVCATGGTTPYAWTQLSGTLPAGTSLSTTTSTCVTLSGTLSTATAYTFTLRVTDNAAATDSQAFTVTVTAVTTTCSGGGGPWALIADTCAGASSSNGSAAATTAAVVTTGADLAFCAVADDINQAATPVTDSKSNTWSLMHSTTSEFGRVALYYSRLTSVGSGHTFTANPGGVTSFPAIQCMVFSGSMASPLDDASAGGGVTAATFVSPGSVSFAQIWELSVMALNAEDSNIVAADGFTVYQRSYSLDKSFGVALGWKLQGGSPLSPQTDSWTWSTPMSASTVAGSFKSTLSSSLACALCRLRFTR